MGLINRYATLALRMSSKLIIINLVAVTAVSVIGAYVYMSQKAAPITVVPAPRDANVIRYLPLGDSYTIGQSVGENERWPNQLADSYKPGGKQLSILANPAVTGYTTQNLIERELPLVKQLQPDFVTVQIGVNDHVRGVSPESFEKNLNSIISQLSRQLQKPNNILLVTIPDFAKTPGGATFGDAASSTRGIEKFNQIIKDVGAKNNIPVADIFAVSQAVVTDPELVADDGLHPSSKQYTAWTAIIKQSLETAKLPD